MRVVDGIRIRQVYACAMLSRVAFWGVIRALQSDINIWYPPHLSAPH
jgi:hypothetical protein